MHTKVNTLDTWIIKEILMRNIHNMLFSGTFSSTKSFYSTNIICHIMFTCLLENCYAKCFHCLTLVSSCALARLSTAIAKNTLSNVSVHSIVKKLGSIWTYVPNLQQCFHVQLQNDYYFFLSLFIYLFIYST